MPRAGTMPAPGPLQALGALLDPAGRDAVPLPERLEPLVAIAGRQLVVPALGSLRRLDDDPAASGDLPAYIAAMHGLNLRRNTRLIAQATEIAGTLNAVGIEPVFLKGTALLLLGVFPGRGHRLIGDIDLMVETAALERAAAALMATGYRRLPDGVAHAHDPVKLVDPDRPAIVELHQSAVSLAIEPLLPREEVLRRSVRLGGPSGAFGRAPCPETLVVHNVLHAMLQHRFYRQAELPLRDALDLVHLARRFAADLDWAAIERRFAFSPFRGGELAFYLAATRAVFPDAPLDVPPPTGASARKLARWRRRGGRPPSPTVRRIAFLQEHLGDRLWRLRHVEGEPRRVLGALARLHRYPRYASDLLGIARGGPPTASAGRVITRAGAAR